ncbi:MAG TPA: branched-chain-amino-acid transaminase [Kiritimatiellia bacterium]|nr:branched-chain-amino-acid transaminase [Kiritimatiellia bacterium]HMO97658.1 branched-chain-amino-acid transaminase [Kiritimatiellia bacterium]HMP95519.1 branched-chain-amino-acid transaminase [Kiritimatiellia bacterium]
MQIYLNGNIVPEKEAVVSVFDHGLLYGDGVFEGIRAYHGKVFRLDEHIDRLFRSAAAIALVIPMTREAMAAAVVETCKANGITDGYIRLIVTRGVGSLGLNPYLCKEPQVIIIAGAIQLYPKELYQTGMNVVTVGTVRNHVEAINPRIKSLNYLNNVLAKIEAINAGVMECIMLNPQGFVAEASGDNIFVVRGRQLITPPVWCGALEGITREVVMQLAPACGLTVKEDVLTRYDLYTADELFLTGTAAEIISVVNVDRRVIGGGAPGPYTQALLKAFGEETKNTGTPIA